MYRRASVHSSFCSMSTAPDEADDRGPVGVDADDVGSPAQFPIQALLWVG